MVQLKTLSLLGALGCSAEWLGDTLPQDVADAFGAKCLNGAPPSYEIFRNASDSRWVLFLEGGGWCYGATANATKQSCAGRAGYVWPPTTSDGSPLLPSDADMAAEPLLSGADIGGIMAADPSINPDFHTWNKVFLRYCDGASFGGFATDPVLCSTRGANPQPASMWLRGRGNFNAMISYLQLTLGMTGAGATEIILSGGSAGGLAVLYNLDHLATLLPAGGKVRLTGFPDAGFFLDGARACDGAHTYRDAFMGADPVWNVTGSGGTNVACLADQKAGEAWKCLMAPYLAKYIKTPLYVMNSAYDAWQMGNILDTPCLPAPNRAPCTAAQNATLRAYHDQFLAAVTAVTDGKPANGVYVDGCYVHEQNVGYCSGQGMPNCVGWSPLEAGSKKWGYSTAVKVPDGRSLTPQQAFGAFYRGDKGAAVAIDGYGFFDNPSCFYRGGPAPPPPTPPTPPPPPTPCSDFSGHFRDTRWTPSASDAVFTQSGCAGSFTPGEGSTSACAFTVRGDVITTCPSFYNSLQGTLSAGASEDTITWANKDTWERSHAGTPTPPPTPAPTSPRTITCAANHTACAATYSASGQGCCVLPNAVCCPNKQTCCPQGTQCVDGGGVLTQCVPTSTVAPVPAPTPGVSVCKPGAQKPFAAAPRKNVIVLGDSVSIGYTPYVAALLANVALVQHAPFDTRDGGAEETAYGLKCLEYFVKDPAGKLLQPDVLMFNFGLHDGPLGNATEPGQQGNSSVYPGELEQIARGLQRLFPPATSRTKLLFALTSPMLCNANADGNVVGLNNEAAAIMAALGVPTVDPHAAIVAKCGAVPQQACFGANKCFCPHCSGAGYSWLANSTLAPAIRGML